ncbi:MAG: hypothetical protein ABII82_00865 [Verrucomicrobiota bacterium]
MAHLLRHLIRHPLRALFAAACVATACAQDNPGRPQPVTVAVCPLDDSPLWTSLHLLPIDNRPPVKISLRGNQRSAPVRLTRPQETIVLGVPRPDPESGEITYVPVVKTPWPAGASQVLIVLAPGTPVRAAAFDDGPETFPVRSVRVFNATGVPLLGRIDDFQGDIPPGISDSHPYTVASDNPNQIGTFPMAFATQDAQGGRLLTESPGEAWPYGRSLIVLQPPAPGATDVRMHIIVDAPPPPKPAANP